MKKLLLFLSFFVLIGETIAQTTPIIDYQLPKNATMEYETTMTDMQQQKQSALTTVMVQESEGTSALVMFHTHSFNQPQEDEGKASVNSMYKDIAAVVKQMKLLVKIEKGEVKDLVNYEEVKKMFKTAIVDIIKKIQGDKVDEHVVDLTVSMMEGIISPKTFAHQCSFFMIPNLPEQLNEEKTTTMNDIMVSKAILLPSDKEGEYIVKNEINVHVKKEQMESLGDEVADKLDSMNLGEGLAAAILSQLDDFSIVTRQEGTVLRSGIVKNMNSVTKITTSYQGESMDMETKSTVVMK